VALFCIVFIVNRKKQNKLIQLEKIKGRKYFIKNGFAKENKNYFYPKLQ